MTIDEKNKLFKDFESLAQVWVFEQKWEFPQSSFETAEGKELLKRLKAAKISEVFLSETKERGEVLIKKRKGVLELQEEYCVSFNQLSKIKEKFEKFSKTSAEKVEGVQTEFEEHLKKTVAIKARFETAWHFYHIDLKGIEEQFEKLKGLEVGSNEVSFESENFVKEKISESANEKGLESDINIEKRSSEGKSELSQSSLEREEGVLNEKQTSDVDMMADEFNYSQSQELIYPYQYEKRKTPLYQTIIELVENLMKFDRQREHRDMLETQTSGVGVLENEKSLESMSASMSIVSSESLPTIQLREKESENATSFQTVEKTLLIEKSENIELSTSESIEKAESIVKKDLGETHNILENSELQDSSESTEKSHSAESMEKEKTFSTTIIASGFLRKNGKKKRKRK